MAIPSEAQRTAIYQQSEHVVGEIARALARRLPPCFAREDLEQDGRLALWAATERWSQERGASWAGYARCRVRGAMLNVVAGRWREEQHEEIAVAVGAPAPAVDLDRQVLWSQSMARVGSEVRRVLVMQHRGLTQREIAKEWRCSQARVSQLQAVAVRELRAGVGR